MSIRSQISEPESSSEPKRSDNLSTNFTDIPTCSIEDIDKALFMLFDKDLPLTYTQRNDTKRVPIIFSSGERFALLARKKPLRDKSKALILPIISITRKNVNLGNDKGESSNTTSRHVIKKQISHEDPIYQQLINKLNLQNSDNLVSPTAFIDATNEIGSLPGRIATRRNPQSSNDNILEGNVLSPSIKNNIFEIFDIPPIIHITAEYEITIWTQYVQEMNNLIMTIASETHFHSVPSFRIETSKGYYFVAYLDKSFNSQNNFDDFSEEERLVRTSFTITIPGYIIGAPYVGSSNRIRRYVSAPQISFQAVISDDQFVNSSYAKISSGNPGDFILENVRGLDESMPGQSVAGNLNTLSSNGESLVGGSSNAAGEKFVRTQENPFHPGKIDKKIITTKTATTRQGETVYREIF